MPLVDECPIFKLCMAFAKEENKQSTISLEKADLVYDSIAKI
jgi:hypothetical protein